MALTKLATAFSDLDNEADEVVATEYERRGSMPSGGEIDLGDVADLAMEYGIQYYETMSGIRQGVLNLLAVGLHHLFEQQQLAFLRQGPARGEEPALRVSELERRLAWEGIDCRVFRSAGKLYELRKAANAVKHGAGPAAKDLAALRPDLFKDPLLGKYGLGTARTASLRASELGEVLAGEGLYVSERDLSDWCSAVIDYWNELAAKLDDQHHQQ